MQRFDAIPSLFTDKMSIRRQIQDGRQGPYLLPDRNQIRVRTRSTGKDPRQVYIKSKKRSWRRCDNKIVTGLIKGEVVISKMSGKPFYY